MTFLGEVMAEAWRALIDFGPELRSVVVLTLIVSGLSTVMGCTIGIPLGAGVALGRFRGKALARVLIGVGMGLPPVLVGLVLLTLFWRTGPFGALGLTFTPTAMVIAQMALAIPVAAGFTMGAIQDLPVAALEQMAVMKLGAVRTAMLALGEIRAGLVAAVVAAFGRVIAEVGAVLVVGGNILGETRVLTTLIVQESRQGRFGFAFAAGAVLLLISMVANIALDRFKPS